MERPALPPMLHELLHGSKPAPGPIEDAVRHADSCNTFSVAAPRDWTVQLRAEAGESFMRVVPRESRSAEQHIAVCCVRLGEHPTVSLSDWSDTILTDVLSTAEGVDAVSMRNEMLAGRPTRVFRFLHRSGGATWRQTVTCLRAFDRGYLISHGVLPGAVADAAETVVRSFRLESGGML